MACTPLPRRCSPNNAANTADLATLIRFYRIHNQPDSVREAVFFRDQPSLERAIHYAALATDHREKRYSHQRRISQAPLKRAKQILMQSARKIEKCDSFHELHSWLAEALSAVRGLGELYIYDTAFRLGAFRGLAPKSVYLHRGTRSGAYALGLRASGGHLSVEDLPKPLHSLAPHEIEDFLCIYKDSFTHLRS